MRKPPIPHPFFLEHSRIRFGMGSHIRQDSNTNEGTSNELFRIQP